MLVIWKRFCSLTYSMYMYDVLLSILSLPACVSVNSKYIGVIHTKFDTRVLLFFFVAAFFFFFGGGICRCRRLKKPARVRGGMIFLFLPNKKSSRTRGGSICSVLGEYSVRCKMPICYPPLYKKSKSFFLRTKHELYDTSKKRKFTYVLQVRTWSSIYVTKHAYVEAKQSNLRHSS